MLPKRAPDHDIVQQELKNSNRRDCKGLFAGKLICSECGSTFGCKVWHSTDKYRCTIWRCNGKYAGNHKCSTPHLKEEDIKNAFVKAVNKLPFNQKEVISTLKESLSQIFDTSAKEADLEHIEAEIAVTSELIKKSLTTPITSTFEEGSSGFDAHVSKIAELQKQYQELADNIADIKHRKGLINQYLRSLRNRKIQSQSLMKICSTALLTTVPCIRMDILSLPSITEENCRKKITDILPNHKH